MTLVEVMATLGIASLLAAGSMLAACNLSKSQSKNQHSSNMKKLNAELEYLLTRDVLNASRIKQTENGFALETLSELNDNMALLHKQIEVNYSVISINSKKWLIRRQLKKGKKQTSQFVCCGINNICIENIQEENDLKNQWQNMPDSIKVSIKHESADEILKLCFRSK